MFSIHTSIAGRLALGYGLLVALSIALVGGILYVGTVGVLDRSIDSKVVAIADRLAKTYMWSLEGMSAEISRQTSDGVDSDTEVFLLVTADGKRLAGNLSGRPDLAMGLGTLVHMDVLRDGKRVPARLVMRQLNGGARLIVGSALGELEQIRSLIWRALAMAGGSSLMLIVGGALLFHRGLERRVAQVRQAALVIGAGDLTRRIPVVGSDEFGRLGGDINQMLDRIEQLVDGVRHVSNAIAHDLRTPLSRVRAKLDAALSERATAAALADTAREAIDDIDQLTDVFEKLLQIAQAESGMRSQDLKLMDVTPILTDIADLYDATAEQLAVTLVLGDAQARYARVDRDLLGSALASLIDNAIKYAGPGATVALTITSERECLVLEVRDNGPGVAPLELARVTERFYRLDRSRHLPGNGLGLSIVTAIATLHGGKLVLDDAKPGLRARLYIPAA